MSETMALTINGEARTVPAGTSVAALIETLGLTGRRVAVERNRELVKRDAWPATALAPGDQLEILHFVGGG